VICEPCKNGEHYDCWQTEGCDCQHRENVQIAGRIETPPEIILRGAFPEYATVPLVVYVHGKRNVIGEATVTGNTVKAVLGEDIAEELLGLVYERPRESQFSLEFYVGPNPYPTPRQKSKPVF